MGNHPSQYHTSNRPVLRVQAQPRVPPEPQQVPGYKQRLAPAPPQHIPSYKNPHCLVLPWEAPVSILKSRNSLPPIPAEDYYSDDQNAGNELDSPDEELDKASHSTKRSQHNGRSRSRTNDIKTAPVQLGYFTPNGERIYKDRRSRSVPADNQSLTSRISNGSVSSGLKKLQNGNYQRRVVENSFVQGQVHENVRGKNRQEQIEIDCFRVPDMEHRVMFDKSANQEPPELGAVVKQMPRRQKGKAPPPPAQPPPVAETPPPPPPLPQPRAPLPFAVIQMEDLPEKPVFNKRQNLISKKQNRRSLHVQLQEEIIKAAMARQSRVPVPPPKINKPKTGEEEFRDQLIKACKRIETYQGEETDVDATATGRESEWDTAYDPSDYKPKTISKFLLKPNVTRTQQLRERLQARLTLQTTTEVQNATPTSVTAISPLSVESDEIIAPWKGSSKTAKCAQSSAATDTKVQSNEDWTPEQDLNEDMENHYDNIRQSVVSSAGNVDAGVIFGPGMRMNMQESSIGSVRMYRSRSTDQGRPEKPTKHNSHHRKSDGSIRTKSSFQSLKDSLRSAFSSIGVNRKERKPVKGFFDQAGYHYRSDVQPVIFYHPQEDAYYQNLYPISFGSRHALSPTMPALSPAMPYGLVYEDPYRLYHPRPVRMQPIMLMDGMHRRALSMEEMSMGQHPFGPAYIQPREKKSRNGRSSKSRSAIQYSGSWSSLKDGTQYEQVPVSKSSWRRWKARGRERSKSIESIRDWNRGEHEKDAESSDEDDDESMAMSMSQDWNKHDASRHYQEATQRGNRRPRGKKHCGISSSSDENKPPNKLSREDCLPPSGAKPRNKYRKRGVNDINL